MYIVCRNLLLFFYFRTPHADDDDETYERERL